MEESALPGALTSVEKAAHVHQQKEGGEKEGRTIMGVRHREWTVEGVQFHPESVTTEYGMKMLGNFLRLRGGTWKEATLV